MTARKRPYRVHYTRNGKSFWDAMRASGPRAAAEKLVKLAAELGWTVEIE
jgi:hypothetical protein